MGWFIGISVATLGSNLSYWIALKYKFKITPTFCFKWAYIRKKLKTSLPILPHYYSNYLLNTSDLMMMRFMGIETKNIGQYNVSYLFGNFIQQIGNASGKAAGPLLYQFYNDEDEFRARKLVFGFQAFFLLMTFNISIYLKEMFSLLIKNSNLAKMYPLAVIIVMAYAYRPMYLGANNKLLYSENTKDLLKVSLVAGSLNVLLNLILIPIYGFKIAAVTTYISLIYMGYSGYFLKAFKEINRLSYFPILWLIATIFLTILAIYAVETNLVLKLILSVFSILSFLIGMKKLNSQTPPILNRY
jgi:O-antigen/teichoic acid export membrane protein